MESIESRFDRGGDARDHKSEWLAERGEDGEENALGGSWDAEVNGGWAPAWDGGSAEGSCAVVGREGRA